MTSQVVTRSPHESAFFTDQNTKSIALIEQNIYDLACPKALAIANDFLFVEHPRDGRDPLLFFDALACA
jgi:hypothetical protein